jgi:hypothetical protein
MKPKSASEKRASGLKEPTWSCTMAQGLQSTRLMCAESYQPEKGTLPAAMLQQPPDAKFRYQPPVAMRCHDSISKEVWGPLGSVAVPEYASKLHYFQGVDAYCRHSLFASWPPCPPAAAPLSKEDVFFGVLTTREAARITGTCGKPHVGAPGCAAPDLCRVPDGRQCNRLRLGAARVGQARDSWLALTVHCPEGSQEML